MHIRVPVALALILFTVALLGGLTAGCSDNAAPRSVLRVTEINNNQPLESDVAKGPDSSLTVQEDVIAVTVSSTPHDAVLNLTSDQPFGSVTLESYEITFASGEAILPVSGALGWTVQSGSSVTGSLVVVPASHKTRPPLLSLLHGGEIQTIAHLTITGREATTGHVMKVESSFPVNFANWADH
jgi:hypothetical protein